MDFSATRSLLERWTRDGTLPGAAAIVERRGERLFDHAAGCARREPYAPAGVDAVWAVASISKPVAATAVLQLVDAGALRLDQPVVELLPEFAPARERILLRHLLTHTSGMTNEFPADEAVAGLPVAAALARVPVLFEPGTACTYSTPAFTLLGPIVERATGLSFEAYALARVFAPLGMNDSHFHPPASWSARIPAVYDEAGDLSAWWSLPHLRVGGGPGGGLYSTLGDLAAFGRAFLDGGRPLLSSASHREMTRLHTPRMRNLEGRPQSWGLGWYLYRDDRPANGFAGLLSRSAYGHGGMTGTWLGVDPEQELVIVLVANQIGIDLATSSDMQAELVRTIVDATA